MELLTLDPAKVTVEGRVRTDLGNIDELAESIKISGQIHPIRITKDYKLVAGERRLRACQKAQLPVLAIFIEQTSEIELREIELRENLDRKDMTWQEQVLGRAALDALKKSQHGESKPGRGAKGWSQHDTAEMLGVAQSEIAKDIKVAKAMQVFPELATLKTREDAVKKINKITEKMAIAELMRRKKERAAETGEGISADDHFIVGDAIAGLKRLPEKSVNFANVDTPYGVDLKENKKIQTGIRTDEDYVEWDREDYIANITVVASEVYRILKDDSWMLFWFGQEWYAEVRAVLTTVGFSVDKIPAIWHGGAGAAQTAAVDVNLARSYETFFVCRKGSPLLLKRGRINTFVFDKVPAQRKIHPTEKPVELMKELYETFLLPGQIGISPFIGSGNDLRAGYMHHCHWFGFDLNEDVKNKFLLRVEEDRKNGLY